MELRSKKVVEEGGFSTRLGSEDRHNEKFLIVYGLFMDPLEHLSERGSLNLVNITVDDLHSLAVFKVLADYFAENLATC